METKELKIETPEGFEIDKENSTFEKIVFKKVEKEVKTWDNLNNIKGYYIHNDSCLLFYEKRNLDNNKSWYKNIFIDEKHAKSALAMAQISQLMPYYGGAITDEEWADYSNKYTINKIERRIVTETWNVSHYFLAFHTEAQRDEFLKNNEQLVKDYLMIE